LLLEQTKRLQLTARNLEEMSIWYARLRIRRLVGARCVRNRCVDMRSVQWRSRVNDESGCWRECNRRPRGRRPERKANRVYHESATYAIARSGQRQGEPSEERRQRRPEKERQQARKHIRERWTHRSVESGRLAT